MQAVIKQEQGKFYVSTVFGYCRELEPEDGPRIINSSNCAYYIVWDEEKSQLIKWPELKPDPKYLIKQILIVDQSHDNWVFDDIGNGWVDFLPLDLAKQIIDNGTAPEDIIARCIAEGAEYEFKSEAELLKTKDAENLLFTVDQFHDAWIEECKVLDDGSLYVYLKGMWGCELDLWFSGDVEYDISSRDPDDNIPYWDGGSLVLQDGFIYLIDDKNATVEEIDERHTCFKAKHVKYHLIF